MKKITIQVPEQRVPFIMELFQKFNFVGIANRKDYRLSQEQEESLKLERARAQKDVNYSGMK